MKRIFLSCALLISPSALACSGGATSEKGVAANVAVDSQAAKKDEGRRRGLEERIGQIAAEAKGRVGVAALVLETGDAVSLNAHDHFPMQSVYKLPIGMAVLRMVDEGKLKLEGRVRVEKSDFVRSGQRSPVRDENPKGVELSVEELLRYAVAESDGTASDVLLKLAGGAQGVGAYLDEIKVGEMIVLNSEKEIGGDWETQYRNWASPDAAVALLRALHERRGLSAESRALMLKLLTQSTPGAKRLKGLLPKGTAVAHKTGTSGARGGITAATNDIGLLTLPNGRHIAVAVFVSDSPADEAVREGVIAKVARAVWDAWGN